MDAIVARSKELLAEPGGWGRIGFYTSGQLYLEEYYTLGVIGKAGIGTPHMDGNTRLCTATAAAALKASFGSDGQPGSYADVDHCDAIVLHGHNVAATQAVLWMRMLDRRRGPDPPALVVVDPARHAPGARGRRPPGAAPRHQPRPPQRAHPRGPRTRLGGRGLRPVLDAGVRGAPPYRRRLSAGSGGADLRRSGPRRPGGGPDHRHQRAPPLDGAPGRLPVAPGDGDRVPGQQPPPPAGHARAARVRRAPDERPADGAEHPRDRRRRRPARLPQLGQPRAHRGARRAVERRGRRRSPTGRRPRTRCRSSATPSRAPSACCGSRRPIPPSRCPICLASAGSSAGRGCSWSSQDLFLTETALLADVVLPAATWAREAGHLHERRPHRPPLGEGGRTRRARRGRPGHLARLRAPDGLPRP